MKNQSVYVRVPPPCNTSVPPGRNTPVQKPIKTAHFGRVERLVNRDKRISARAFRVFAALACSERGGVSTIGFRQLGEDSAIHWPRLGPLIEELVKAGLVSANRTEKGKRQTYQLLTPLFSAGAGAVPKKICLECKREFKRLPREGVCKICTVDAERTEQYRQVAAKLGPDAKHSEIVRVLQADESNRRWQRIGRQARLADEIAILERHNIAKSA